MVTQPQDLSGLMWKVQSRTGLSRLEDTEGGDVFFLVADPSRVYLRNPREPRWKDDYSFIEVEDDCWRRMEHVGDGTPGQIVMVVHNTQKPLREPGGRV